jgi:hypothetical protein
VRYDDSDCTMKGMSMDGWTLNLSWDYLMGTTRQYYAALGDPFLAPENQTGVNREVPPILSITGWAGRETYVDNQPYDTLNTYRFFYGLSAEEYSDGSVPTAAEKNLRCTANNSAKWVNELTFVVPQSFTATVAGTITGGTVIVDPARGPEGTPVTVNIVPDEGKKLVNGSVKYTADSGSTYTAISKVEGIYCFNMPVSDVIVTAQFTDLDADIYTVTVDSEITGGSIAVNPESDTAGAMIAVNVTADSGKRLTAGSLKYTADGGSTYTLIPGSGSVYSFVLPEANVNVTARFENIPDAIYTVTPQSSSAYTIGSTIEGINTMTIKNGVTGLEYFRVNISPVISHDGLETIVFIHIRDNIQIEWNATRADFDLVEQASAGFNVRAGDVIQAYVVDNITNDPLFTPTVYQ